MRKVDHQARLFGILILECLYGPAQLIQSQPPQLDNECVDTLQFLVERLYSVSIGHFVHLFNP